VAGRVQPIARRRVDLCHQLGALERVAVTTNVSTAIPTIAAVMDDCIRHLLGAGEWKTPRVYRRS